MASWTISGSITVVDDNNQPVANPTTLTISALDEDLWYHDPLGIADVSGSKTTYSIPFDSSKFKNWWNFWEGNPDVRMTLYAPGRRIIAQKNLGSIPPGTKTVDFKVHVLHLADGFRVSLPMSPISKNPIGGYPDDPVLGTTPLLSDKNELIPFVDNKAAWAAADEIARGAASDIAFSELNFAISESEVTSKDQQPRSLIMEFGNGDYPDTSGFHLGDVMADDVTCPVRILLNDNKHDTLIPDDVDNVTKYFAAKKMGDRVKVRGLNLGGATSFLHAKNLIVDQKTVVLLGSPLDQQYYNDCDHPFADYRRGLSGERPRHDVSVQVTGAAAADLYNGFFRVHWNSLSNDDSLPLASKTDGSGNAVVQVVRSLRKGIDPVFPDGETGILEAYQRAIASAKKYIYLENQFITCPEVIDSLSLALTNSSDLEAILLVNIEYTKGEPYYSHYQNDAIDRLYENLKNNKPAWDRVGIFVKWSHNALSGGSSAMINDYIHAKVGIVDDTWAIVGSANLDGVSLLKREFSRFDARSKPSDYSELENAKDERSSEICVSVSDSCA